MKKKDLKFSIGTQVKMTRTGVENWKDGYTLGSEGVVVGILIDGKMWSGDHIAPYDYRVIFDADPLAATFFGAGELIHENEIEAIY